MTNIGNSCSYIITYLAPRTLRPCRRTPLCSLRSCMTLALSNTLHCSSSFAPIIGVFVDPGPRLRKIICGPSFPFPPLRRGKAISNPDACNAVTVSLLPPSAAVVVDIATFASSGHNRCVVSVNNSRAPSFTLANKLRKKIKSL